MAFFDKGLKRLHKGRYLSTLFVMLMCASALANSSAELPARKMTKSRVTQLASQYIAAVQAHDFEAWRELLSPMHLNAPELDEELFLETIQPIQSLRLGEIDGLNVEIKIKDHLDRTRLTSLQIHSSGQIKYTPLLFQHPVRKACNLLKTLLFDTVSLFGANTNEALRFETAQALVTMGIPLCGYDPLNPSIDERRAAAREILRWLEENGKAYDNSAPKVHIPLHEFDRCMTARRPKTDT